MHLLIRRAFPVRFEWRRLGQLVIVMGGIAAAGDVLLPTHGAVGFVTRAAAFAVIPLALWVTGFAHQQELERVHTLLSTAARRRAAGEPA